MSIDSDYIDQHLTRPPSRPPSSLTTPTNIGLPVTSAPADGYFLNDNDPPTCKPCKASVVTSSLLVPAAMGITIVLLLAVALHPASRNRVYTILRWFKFKSEDLLTLSGKLSVLFQTCQTVRAAVIHLQRTLAPSTTQQFSSE